MIINNSLLYLINERTSIMANKINFFRIIRTQSSEAYGSSNGKYDLIGRFDIHYANDGRIDAVIIRWRVNRFTYLLRGEG